MCSTVFSIDKGPLQNHDGPRFPEFFVGLVAAVDVGVQRRDRARLHPGALLAERLQVGLERGEPRGRVALGQDELGLVAVVRENLLVVSGRGNVDDAAAELVVCLEVGGEVVMLVIV